MRKTTFAAAAVTAAAMTWVSGCGQSAQPLSPEVFLARRQVDGTGRVQPVDQSGALVVGSVNPEPLTPARNGAGGDPSVARTVEESVQPVTDPGFQNNDPATASATPPATAPAARVDPAPLAAAAEGGYQLIGTVLAEVNGSPIYADKVLAILEKPLEAEAKKRDSEAEFKAVAADLIKKQVAELVNAELEYAVAQRSLGAQEQAEARARTVQWRIEQIAAAGGSEELARKKWAADGFDFEERSQEQYRTLMVRLFYTKKVFPRIQVSQSDIRSYYEANKLKPEFTTQATAQFRVIMVDFKKSGGEQAALDKASRILKRAQAGEDFAELAKRENDEPLYMQPFAQPFPKGSFAIEEVENAVWSVQNGQLTPLVKTKDAYYIALLEKKAPGRTVPFEEAQEKIMAKLKNQQFAVLRAEVQQRLVAEARSGVNQSGISQHPQMMQVAMDMVMQRYATWKGTASAR